MPMQPSPIAETSGPSLPRRRLPTWNINSPFLGAEPPSRLCQVKWDRNPLVTRRRARNDRQFGTADPERLGEQPDHRLIGGAVGGRFGNLDLELFAAVRAFPPAADARPRRAWTYADRDDRAQSIATCWGLRPRCWPRFISSNSGSTAKVTSIISLKSSR